MPWHSRCAVRFALAAVVAIAASAPAARAAPTGTIAGIVSFEGTPPERTLVRRDSDPYCNQGELWSDAVVVTHGKLKDVLVRVATGGKPAAKPPSAPAVIDQKACAYTPRVIGLVAGQQLAVRNSDGTFHNVHGSIAGKLAWNKPAAPGDPELRLDGSARAGDVIDIVCDVHPWMHAYAVVLDHASFAVTGEDGAFELRGLPPGRYTIEAWHPTLGTRTTTVTLTNARATARLSYRGERP